MWEADTNSKGQFVRASTRFRNWVKQDGSTSYTPEAGRYHLYASYACPWATRTLILRMLRKLEPVISVSIVGPVWNQNGWWFSDDDGVIPDGINGKRDLIEIYRLADPSFSEDETVPILWDKHTRTIVSNESRDIIRMFDLEFSELGDRQINLCPPHLLKRVDEVLDAIYEPINNGVYRAGFARSQAAYESAVREVFSALEHWESVLSSQPYLCGNALTEADICLFTTLIRFDAVYYSHFKCNLRRIGDMPALRAYVARLYSVAAFHETFRLDHIKRHYYECHRSINPTGIVPLGPKLEYLP